MATKSQYYRILNLLNTDISEDRRERKILLNKYLAEKNKADIDELSRIDADILISWLEAIC